MVECSSDTLADWIIAAHHRSGEPVTNLRVQKLLYYVQAWHLAIEGTPLFAEDFQAWIHGPVLPSLYRRLKAHGSSVIPSPDDSGDEDGVPLPEVPKEVGDHLAEVLDVYGSFNTWQLEQMTHNERPWLEARAGLPVDAPSRAPISQTTMKEFYGSKLKNG